MLYFTSDLHLGHSNIIRHCNRPFADINEMNESLIANWNAVIKSNDDIYILGDMFFRNTFAPETMLKRMKGRKHLILGNHDKKWIKTIDLSQYFEQVTNLLTYKLDGIKYTLCHFPMLSWEGRGHGGYMIHGHTHNTELDYKNKYLLNACVDINNYFPVTFEQLIENNKNFSDWKPYRLTENLS